MTYFVHDRAICETAQVGVGSKIWAFARISTGAVIGKNCDVGDNVFIDNDVVLGDNVTIQPGARILDGVRLADRVVVGPNATFSRHPFLSGTSRTTEAKNTIIETGAYLGANATILSGVTVGRNAAIQAGAVVAKSVPPNAIVAGNPARIIGYVTDHADSSPGATHTTKVPSTIQVRDSEVAGVKIFQFPEHSDLRGSLVALDLQKDLPFVPKRQFFVFDVPTQEVRGEHAHRECHQLLICVRGRVSALVDNGKVRSQYELTKPFIALYMPPMIWGTQYRYSEDAVLLVLASHAYSATDYVRDYHQYLELISNGT